MPSSVKNATGAKYSTPKARATYESGTLGGAKSAPTITLTLTGVGRNPYLYSIRKAFSDFLKEETRDILVSDLRLTKKIEAARLLFPEARLELKCKTVKI